MGLLRSIFGPSKKEIWNQIADDIGAVYEDGGFWGHDALRYQSGNWEVTLDTYTTGGKHQSTYTRMRAPFVNKDSLYFVVYREGFFSSIGKMFGMQDVQIGDPFFDEEFVIKSNSEEKIKLLLNGPVLKQLIQEHPDIRFEIKDDEGWFGAQFPEGVDELYFRCYGVVKSEELLLNLFELFCITLERLVRIDSAYEVDPDVAL